MHGNNPHATGVAPNMAGAGAGQTQQQTHELDVTDLDSQDRARLLSFGSAVSEKVNDVLSDDFYADHFSITDQGTPHLLISVEHSSGAEMQIDITPSTITNPLFTDGLEHDDIQTTVDELQNIISASAIHQVRTITGEMSQISS